MIAGAGCVSQEFQSWRATARACLARELSPNDIAWDASGSATLLFGDAIPAADLTASSARVSRQFLSLAESVACHREDGRWASLYQLLWRMNHGEPHLMQIASDPLMSRLVTMHRAVRRAAHKMKAFVRFRVVGPESDLEYIAWFEPMHRVVERTAPFFVDRFRSMKWSILTPDGCARWDTKCLTLTRGIERHEAPATEDRLEDLWRAYYAGTFNPARLNRAAMRAEMPLTYWKNLPESRIIDDLARAAPARVTAMIEQTLRAPENFPVDIETVDSMSTVAEDVAHESWDPVYDPGWREARRRAEAITFRAPFGIERHGSRVISGVAGWTDPTLLAPGVFYPDDATTPESRLRYYASVLPMVEVDATYYVLPSADTSERWVERTPSHFVFNIKAHSLMTGHPTNPARLPKWLRDDLPESLRSVRHVYSHHFSTEAIEEVWRRFISALMPLKDAGKLGAIMLQYPRWFTPSRKAAAELTTARNRLGDTPATVEIRHRDWATERIASRFFALLSDLEFSYVAVDAPAGLESSVPPIMEVTNPRLAAFRFHGRRVATWEARNEEVAERYRYLYERDQLDLWRPAIERAIEKAMTVHLTFNNNKWNYAVANALEMNDLMLSEE